MSVVVGILAVDPVRFLRKKLLTAGLCGAPVAFMSKPETTNCWRVPTLNWPGMGTTATPIYGERRGDGAVGLDPVHKGVLVHQAAVTVVRSLLHGGKAIRRSAGLGH